MAKPQALQIVEIKNHTYSLNYNKLAKVLSHPEIRDRKVAVISVAGAFRKGKSFLLGFFLRYLYAQYEKKDVTDWLENGGDTLEGFSWRNGMKRETTGVLMWRQIFLHDYNEVDKIAIILLDTQGVYDNQSTAQDCAFIFALSTLLSSVQIYNLSQNIHETDLQHLELFTEYGRMALEQSEHKPFQQMLFLIRDWPFAFEYNYGAVGGNEMLENCLKITNQHEEQSSVRSNLKKCFSEMGCFLMPHPGKDVACNPKFRGQLDLIENEFKDALKELVPLILAPQNLKAKEIYGQKIQAKDFIHYFDLYVKELSGDGVPRPETILNANAEVNHMNILSEVTELYISEMKKVCDCEEHMSEQAFEAYHLEVVQNILLFFDSKKKLGGPDISKKYRKRLTKGLNEGFERYKQCNKSKIELFREKERQRYLNAKQDCIEFYEKEMNKAVAQDQFVIDANCQENYMKTIMEMFNAHKIHGGDVEYFYQIKKQLADSINTQYELFKKIQEDTKKTARNAQEGYFVKRLNESREFYFSRMEQFFTDKQYMEGFHLEHTHDTNKKSAVLMFEEDGMTNSEFFVMYQKYYDRLVLEISDIYAIYKKRNMDRKKIHDAELDANNTKAMIDALAFYRNEVEALFQKKKDYVTEDEANELHEKLKDKALEKYNSGAIDKGKDEKRSYNIRLKNLEKEIHETYKHYMRIRKDKDECCTIL